MPEIPEIASRATEMDRALSGKTIESVEIVQPKCLNLPSDEFAATLVGARIESTSHHGKWIKMRTSQGWILINMGMGGELLLTTRAQLPDKYRVIIDFNDKTCLVINFWWFGYVHSCAIDALNQHPLVSKLGPDILSVGEAAFCEIIAVQKGKLKSFLLDQSKYAGIGNAYIHDILFLARLHPNRSCTTLSDDEVHRLYQAIQDGLRPSLAKGGAFYELNLFGEKGGFQNEDILIGYRENTPCPVCATSIRKIKTGSTSSFICPTCQAEESMR